MCQRPMLLKLQPPTILLKTPPLVQKALAGSEGQFVDGISREVVANIEHAWSLVARQAIHVFRPVGLAAADRSVVDGMGPGIVGLER